MLKIGKLWKKASGVPLAPEKPAPVTRYKVFTAHTHQLVIETTCPNKAQECCAKFRGDAYIKVIA
jgi:hypothetical protein